MFNVAIDGPAGAGKSSISKAVAQKLNFIYVDTGALYRTVALYLVDNNIEPSDEKAVVAALPKIKVEMKHTESGQRMFLCGDDVTDKIRTPEVSMAASTSSGLLMVREFLFSLQTEMAEKYNVIMDGRDIGTVVLPNAQVKIFLTASAECRAKRRFAEFEAAGDKTTFEEVLADVEKRDFQDSNREVRPLKPAEDSIIVDSTDFSFDKTVEKITALIGARM